MLWSAALERLGISLSKEGRNLAIQRNLHEFHYFLSDSKMQSRRINRAIGNLGVISLELFIGQAGLGASDKFIRVTYHTIEELNLIPKDGAEFGKECFI